MKYMIRIMEYTNKQFIKSSILKFTWKNVFLNHKTLRRLRDRESKERFKRIEM